MPELVAKSAARAEVAWWMTACGLHVPDRFDAEQEFCPPPARSDFERDRDFEKAQAEAMLANMFYAWIRPLVGAIATGAVTIAGDVLTFSPRHKSWSAGPMVFEEPPEKVWAPLAPGRELTSADRMGVVARWTDKPLGEVMNLRPRDARVVQAIVLCFREMPTVD